MPSTCFKVVRGKRLRATILDECGAPPAALTANSQITSAGFVSVQYTLEYEDGDEYIVKNADGALCINSRNCDVFKRITLTISLCEVDPELVVLLTNQTAEIDGAGDTVGFRISRNTECSNFALELWPGLDDIECDDAGNLEYGYVLLPFVKNGTLRDFTIENGPTNFEIQAWTENGSRWGSGPYNVVRSGPGGTPSSLEDPVDPDDHMLFRVTTVAPPAAVCGLQAMPAAPTPAGS
jgi:hypothetical protein